MLPYLTVSFLRNHLHNVGQRVNVCWDGSIDAATGIASPHASPGAGNIDWAGPLNDEPVPIWAAGGFGDGDGMDGAGYDGIGAPQGFELIGDGDGYDGDGYDGLLSDYWQWTTDRTRPPIRLRNGTYTVGLVRVDQWGNLDQGPAADRPYAQITVTKAPETNTRSEVAIAAGAVTIDFKKSVSFSG